MRINDDARKCVVFFGVPTENGIEYGGTGFLAYYEDGGEFYTYLATCRHVAEALEAYADTGFYIRFNTKDGLSQRAVVAKISWCYHPDYTVDLAAVSFDPGALPNHDHLFFSLDSFVDRTIWNEIAGGDTVSLVGLFRLHAGNQRNTPVVHTGHVALIADPAERVPIRDRRTGEVKRSEVHLVEAQTLDGLSGSPVFHHEMIALGDITLPGTKAHPQLYGRVTLLGVYAGAWDGEPGELLAADRARHGQRVPVGMGLVVPIDHLISLIREDPELGKDRKELKSKRESAKAAVGDTSFPEPAKAKGNDTHKEDFNRLLKQAAQKRERED